MHLGYAGKVDVPVSEKLRVRKRGAQHSMQCTNLNWLVDINIARMLKISQTFVD